MSESDERPLVSFCLLAYKQEQFIREAVESALAQDYSPLEIILSDDCSPDRTFEVMEEMVAAYEGPHAIVLNRNPENLGITGHVNRIVELSNGPLIVFAAGDDVSFPERARLLCDEWIRCERAPTSIHSDYEVVDEHSVGVERSHPENSYAGEWSGDPGELADFFRGTHPAYLFAGCTHAFSRALFQQYGPLELESYCEDKLIALRSLLMGSFAYVPGKLVRYREHSSNISGYRIEAEIGACERRRQFFARKAANALRWPGVLEAFRSDVQLTVDKGRLSQAEGAIVLREIDRLGMLKRREGWLYGGSAYRAFLGLLGLLRLQPLSGHSRAAVKVWVFRALDSIGVLPKSGMQKG